MPIRTTWDLAQVFLLLYLLIVVPLRVAFDVTVKSHSLAFWVDVLVDIYFIVVCYSSPASVTTLVFVVCSRANRVLLLGVQDIGFNFRTAYYDSRGIIVIQQRLITRNYLQSWFLIDFITCLPINYILMASYDLTPSVA